MAAVGTCRQPLLAPATDVQARGGFCDFLAQLERLSTISLNLMACVGFGALEGCPNTFRLRTGQQLLDLLNVRFTRHEPRIARGDVPPPLSVRAIRCLVP